MNYAALALIFGALQTLTVLLLSGNKWVHAVTGGKSHATRLDEIETKLPKCVEQATVTDLALQFDIYKKAMGATLDDLHEKASDYASGQQNAVGRIETRLLAIEVQLSAINEHLRNTDVNVKRIDESLERRRGNR